MITTRALPTVTVKLVLVGMWWFTNLSEIGRSRYFLQSLGLRFFLGYDENGIFLTFLKTIGFGNLRFWGFFCWLKNEMHMPLGDYHAITGPSVLLWGLA